MAGRSGVASLPRSQPYATGGPEPRWSTPGWDSNLLPHGPAADQPCRNLDAPSRVPQDMVKQHPRDAVTTGQVLHWAHLYDVFGNIVTLGRAPAMREQTLELARLRAGEHVLEVGCGTGEVAQRARLRVGPDGDVSGVDPSAEMIEVARKKASRAGLEVDYRIGAIEALPYRDANFDVVLSSLMMHHLPDDLKSAGLAEVRRVLKPGGRLLIIDFKRPRRWLSQLAMRVVLHGHLGRGFEQLPAIVAAAGFVDVTSGPTRFDFLGVVSGRAPA
jgi:ubiquinone/menaquinone biosynthesis C-methylase UbiE